MVWGGLGTVLALWPLLIVPALSSGAEVVDEQGGFVRDDRSNLEIQGPILLVVLIVPVVIASAPLVLSRTPVAEPARLVAASLLAAGAVVAIASVGLFYIPSVAALAIAYATGKADAPGCDKFTASSRASRENG